MPKKRSKLEARFEDYWNEHYASLGLAYAHYDFDQRFHPTRLWRFDYAWPHAKVAVEIEGGSFSRGRHTRGTGFAGDCDKYNQAALAGWLVLRFATTHLAQKRLIDATDLVKIAIDSRLST